MKISTKGRYGVRAMLDLALRHGEGPVLLRDIAARLQISERYLEQLIILLKTAGMVTSTRGPHGGFSLSRPPSQMKLKDILMALEGSLAVADCVGSPSKCSLASACATRDLWSKMQNAMNDVLESTTLDDLVQRHLELVKPGTLMYYI